jgi:hypothetical protein
MFMLAQADHLTPLRLIQTQIKKYCFIHVIEFSFSNYKRVIACGPTFCT